MAYTVKVAYAAILLLSPLLAQSDLGSSTNAGGLSDGRLPSDDQKIRLQLKELAKYKPGIEQLLGSDLSLVSKQYEAVRKGGKEMAPLDFLANFKVYHDRDKSIPLEAFASVMATPGRQVIAPDRNLAVGIPPSKSELNAAKAQFKSTKR